MIRKRLRQFRLARGLSLEGLAAQLDHLVTRQTRPVALGHHLGLFVALRGLLGAAGFREVRRQDTAGIHVLGRRHADRVKQLQGTEFSVLRWDAARDDFIRVTTSIHDDTGKRFVDSPLGKDHPARELILAGKPYMGRAMLFGEWYSVNLRPVRNSAGE